MRLFEAEHRNKTRNEQGQHHVHWHVTCRVKVHRSWLLGVNGFTHDSTIDGTLFQTQSDILLSPVFHLENLAQQLLLIPNSTDDLVFVVAILQDQCTTINGLKRQFYHCQVWFSVDVIHVLCAKKIFLFFVICDLNQVKVGVDGSGDEQRAITGGRKDICKCFNLFFLITLNKPLQKSLWWSSLFWTWLAKSRLTSPLIWFVHLL